MFHYFHSLKASAIAATHIRAETAKTDFSNYADRSTVRFRAAKLLDAHELPNSGNSHYRDASLTADIFLLRPGLTLIGNGRK